MRAILAAVVLVLGHLIDAPATLLEHLGNELSGVALGRLEFCAAGLAVADFDGDTLPVARAVGPVACMPGVAVKGDSLHSLDVVHGDVEGYLLVVALHILDLITCAGVVGGVMYHNPGRGHGMRALDAVHVLGHFHFYNVHLISP